MGWTCHAQINLKNMKSKNCIIICNVGIESKSFNLAANRMESKTKTLGFEVNVFLDYKMMKLRTRSVENGTIFSAQEFILKNPSFNSVFFQKVNRLLVLKKELLNYISWFQITPQFINLINVC